MIYYQILEDKTLKILVVEENQKITEVRFIHQDTLDKKKYIKKETPLLKEAKKFFTVVSGKSIDGGAHNCTVCILAQAGEKVKWETGKNGSKWQDRDLFTTICRQFF